MKGAAVIGEHLMPHRIQPVPSVDRVDVYGNHERVPGEPGEPVPAYVQPDDTSESVSGGQVRESRWRVFTRPELGLDAWSHIVWENRRYELVGDPRRFDSPDGAHHAVLSVRRVGG